MTSKVVRKNIVLKDETQEKEFKKFVKKAGFSSFSHLCRHAIIELMKRYNNDSSEEMKQLEDTINIFQDTLYKKIDLINERVELMGMRINKEGITSEVGHALRDIIRLIIKRDMDHSQILAKARKYDDKTKDMALCLLIDSNLGGSGKKQKKVNCNGYR